MLLSYLSGIVQRCPPLLSHETAFLDWAGRASKSSPLEPVYCLNVREQVPYSYLVSVQPHARLTLWVQRVQPLLGTWTLKVSLAALPVLNTYGRNESIEIVDGSVSDTDQ
jgi:hypothetical protein